MWSTCNISHRVSGAASLPLGDTGGKSVLGEATSVPIASFESQPWIFVDLVLASETYRASQRISRAIAAKPREMTASAK